MCHCVQAADLFLKHQPVHRCSVAKLANTVFWCCTRRVLRLALRGTCSPAAGLRGQYWFPHPRRATGVLSEQRRSSCSRGGSKTEASSAAGKLKEQVIVLTGPTAVGKTRVSLALAEAVGGEIISADSVQVYRGLDVGSDKVCMRPGRDGIFSSIVCAADSAGGAQIMPAERRGIPHHLIDILPPQEEFSAGDFYMRARAATADILQVCCFTMFGWA